MRGGDEGCLERGRWEGKWLLGGGEGVPRFLHKFDVAGAFSEAGLNVGEGVRDMLQFRPGGEAG